MAEMGGERCRGKDEESDETCMAVRSRERARFTSPRSMLASRRTR